MNDNEEQAKGFASLCVLNRPRTGSVGEGCMQSDAEQHSKGAESVEIISSTVVHNGKAACSVLSMEFLNLALG